jgi:hypothetical protein
MECALARGDSLLHGSLETFQGYFACQNEAVELVENRILIVRERALARLIDEIVLDLSPCMHQDRGDLDFNARLRVATLTVEEVRVLELDAVVNGVIAREVLGIESKGTIWEELGL